MTVTDELLQNNERFAATFDPAQGRLPMPPGKHIAVVACMDARLNVYGLLGLHAGEAHVICNAGGVASDDVIRSLTISQRLLGTREIILVHHTDCGMLTFDDEEFAQKLENETGQRPDFEAHAFRDLEEDIRESIATIKESPFIPHKDSVRGFIYEVESGRLREIS